MMVQIRVADVSDLSSHVDSEVAVPRRDGVSPPAAFSWVINNMNNLTNQQIVDEMIAAANTDELEPISKTDDQLAESVKQEVLAMLDDQDLNNQENITNHN